MKTEENQGVNEEIQETDEDTDFMEDEEETTETHHKTTYFENFYGNGVLCYSGEIKNGKYWGKGSYYNENGRLSYVGDWQNGAMHGKGTFYSNHNNGVYEGDFENGLANGFGKYIWNDIGSEYIGGWKMGEMHGKGTLSQKSGYTIMTGIWDGINSFLGEVNDYEKNENGEKICIIKYTGKVKNLKKEDVGEYFDYKKKFKYSGNFKSDLWNGFGEISLISNNNMKIYVGQFKDGLFDGNGVYTFPNYERFEGVYSKGLRNGKGKYIFLNGDIFVGNYLDDVRNGSGVFYGKENGFVIKQEFSRDKQIKSENVEIIVL